MSILDTATIWLPDAEKTALAGKSLVATLYHLPVTFWLHGELGAGKTTLLQGFFRALGIQDHVTSPTYALEQRYHSARHGEVLHLDLYRLSNEQARELLLSSNDYSGIRCVEWTERLGSEPEDGIHLKLRDSERGGRDLSVNFQDISLPSREQIIEWRTMNKLPEHIVRHCDAVAKAVEILAQDLLKRSIVVRPVATIRAAEVHDLFRFVDFRPGASHVEDEADPATEAVWESWKQRYPGIKHEPLCSAFLRDQGYPELADIVEPHGLKLPSPERTTIEQKLLFYADKRMKVDEPVTLEERFKDFAVRYGNGKASEMGNIWMEESRQIEQELFPGGVPTL